MKLYNGRLHKTESPAGKIEPKSKPSGQISAVKVFLDDVRIKCINGIQAELNKRGGPQGDSIKVLKFRYVFLTGISNILIRLGRSMTSAPCTDMEKHAGSGSEVGAPLTDQPVTNIHAGGLIKADWSELVLYTYFMVPMRCVRKIATSAFCGMASVLGATFRRVAKVPLAKTSLLISTLCATIQFRVNMWNPYRGKVMSADSVSVKARYKEPNALTKRAASSAPPERLRINRHGQTTGPAIGSVVLADTAEVKSGCGNIIKSGLCTWRFPEQNGANLQIFQVYSGVQSGDVLEVEVEEGNVYWANASNKDGVLSLVFAQTEPQTDNELKVI